jgi:hypothetical protein
MPDQEICVAPVIVTFPAQLDGAAAERAADQITAAFTPSVSVVIADLTAAACCDRSAIRNLLKAHRKAAARGLQVRFAIRLGGPLHQITGFADTHPLLAVYPTLQHALAGRSPIPPGNGHWVLRVRRKGGKIQALALPAPAASRIDAYLASRDDVTVLPAVPGSTAAAARRRVLFATGTGARMCCAEVRAPV